MRQKEGQARLADRINRRNLGREAQEQEKEDIRDQPPSCTISHGVRYKQKQTNEKAQRQKVDGII